MGLAVTTDSLNAASFLDNVGAAEDRHSANNWGLINNYFIEDYRL